MFDPIDIDDANGYTTAMYNADHAWEAALMTDEPTPRNPHAHCSTNSTDPCPTGEHTNPFPHRTTRHILGPYTVVIECTCGMLSVSHSIRLAEKANVRKHKAKGVNLT